MTADVSGLGVERSVLRHGVSIGSDTDVLRSFAIAAGICSSILFVVIGLRYELQMYADGSLFSYSVAVEDAWTFHWHNISGRLFVYLFSSLPAETYVGLTSDPHGSIVIYGFLFFIAPFLGLLATFAADRSERRIIFSYACFSTACLCPLVFGFPTEMWMAHALFWPTLALCHYPRGGTAGIVVVFVALLALVFTHAGALIFAAAILATLLLRGMRDTAFLRAAGAFLVIMLIWGIVHTMVPPDNYDAEVLVRAALNVFNLGILAGSLVLLLLGTLAGYGIAFIAIEHRTPTKAHLYAAAIVAVALAVYWLRFDHALHAENRYYLRTIVLLADPALGALAAAHVLSSDGRSIWPVRLVPRLVTALTSGVMARAITGALLLVMLVNAVETAKFLTAWTDYKLALQALATGSASDPELGNPRFVSSDRIGPKLNRVSWFSTTHFLSVLLAPKFAPTRLVVDPTANYFWLPCKTATANLNADRAVPQDARRLVRVHACLHR